jgi:hypothetical protein
MRNGVADPRQRDAFAAVDPAFSAQHLREVTEEKHIARKFVTCGPGGCVGLGSTHLANAPV